MSTSSTCITAWLAECALLLQPFSWPSVHWWINFKTGEHSVASCSCAMAAIALTVGVPQIMRQDLRCYYLMYAARYMQAIVSVLMEHRRKDFIEMQATDLERAAATRWRQLTWFRWCAEAPCV